LFWPNSMSFSDDFTIEAAPVVSPQNFAQDSPSSAPPPIRTQTQEEDSFHQPFLPPLNPEAFKPLAELEALKTPETPNPSVRSPNDLEAILDPDDIRLQLGLYGCELLNKAGVMLKVPQVVIATAQMYFQRFFRHEANHSHHPNWIAITCIYLATKTEEEKRGYRDILTVFDDVIDGHENQPGSYEEYISRDRKVLDVYGKKYQRWKKRLMENELLLLKELGYFTDTNHPHQYILQIVGNLGCDNLAQKAWAFLNDSYRLPDIVEIKPCVLACAAIFLSARVQKVKLPDNPPWYEVFGVERQEIRKVAQMMLELYDIPWDTKFHRQQEERRKKHFKKRRAEKQRKEEERERKERKRHAKERKRDRERNKDSSSSRRNSGESTRRRSVSGGRASVSVEKESFSGGESRSPKRKRSRSRRRSSNRERRRRRSRSPRHRRKKKKRKNMT